ncbi:CRISPR-associated endonuclease Cas6 [Clostridium aestuarii]|uniref:CRISPR-associated endonuclease Cas6 n=1 Tax=Clostridium aestuarii TaxID=338193 RepID=A0ABT4D2K5_9CLOT|nr:CRISPR-associated endonuclease Cas6 [Clostridium aestuarii]MCY6485477.1 CRISPR-associated endonuclease Cas6 [Clostridium aestuarii]
MKLEVMRLSFENVEIAKRDIPKVRGFIASNYPEYDELHNHKGNKTIYRYPVIQYKSIEGIPCIVALNEGVNVLKKIENEVDNINIENKIIDIFEKRIKYEKAEYGISNTLLKYEFDSPWMCLNDKNFKIYIKSNDEEKKELLKRILIGNILSMSKSMGYTVEEKINVYLELRSCNVKFKNKDMLGFKGYFIINFKIPNYLGLGKSVSRGFGAVKNLG